MADRSASLKPLSSFLLFLGAGDVEWEEEEEGMLAIDWMIWAMRCGWPASWTWPIRVGRRKGE